jgi:ABC-type glycerol-3-phosphate transport system substrate-binding protein
MAVMVKVPAMLVAIALTLTTIPGYTETTIVHMVQHSVRNHLEPLIPSFEAQFPGVKVVLEGPFPATEYVDKLTARIAANLEPDVTDLFYSLAVPFRDAGMFEDLQPWFDRDLKISLKDFVPAAIQSSSHPRYGIWGMPWNMYVLHPIYNDTMFAEAGLADPWSMGKAWTWDTLKEFGGKLTRIDSDGQVQTIGIGSSPTLGRQVQLVNQAGGHIWDQSVQPWESLLLSDPVRIGMTYYIDLFERGIAALVGPGFTSGKVGIEL